MIRSAILASLLLAGCATGTRYPSLAPRAAEKQSFAEPVITPVVAAPDPALDASVAAQTAQLDHIVAGFTAAAQIARHDADLAMRQPVGSEAWLTAQAALARVDDWRAQASALVSAIETIAAARAAKLLPADAGLDALRDRASAESDREGTAVAQVQAMLPVP